MSALIQVSQGGRYFNQFQARDDSPAAAPMVGVFTDGNATTGIIWPAGGSPDNALDVTPVVSWVSATDGIFSVELHSLVTTQIPPGNYKLRANCWDGSERIDLLICDLTILGMGANLAPPVATPTGPSESDLGLLSTLYCTDEHIALRCGPDFTSLLPDSQLLAWGNDGVFTSSDSWTLISPSVDFDSQLAPVWWQQSSQSESRVGYVAWLRKPQSAFPAGGQFMGIAATSGSSVTLRRIGMATNQGQAPSPAAGLVGVSFQVVTFRPQIENATYDLNQRYRIDATVLTRSPTNLADMRVLRRACIAMVLLDSYSDASRVDAGNIGYKVNQVQQELEDLQANLTVRWLTGIDSQRAETNWFSTRLVR